MDFIPRKINFHEFNSMTIHKMLTNLDIQIIHDITVSTLIRIVQDDRVIISFHYFFLVVRTCNIMNRFKIIPFWYLLTLYNIRKLMIYPRTSEDL